ncbi:MAG: hypothetical protein IJO60_01010 [Agathobacter sp.]|nr:hypothetical protein [Agathobacter sp.]
MDKKTRQYIGLFSAILAYYVIHEGAHLVYALCIGVFKQINFIGLGMQIDVYAEKMTAQQLGVFCIVGSVATTIVAYTLVILADKIKDMSSKCFKACMYYITIAMLLIDPLYLSLLCGMFGGGDMNGISMLMPEMAARIGYGVLLVVNIIVFFRIVLPKYKIGFEQL